jgi:hypothetical protein
MQRYLVADGASLWPFSQALSASLALAELPGGERYVRDVGAGLIALERYRGDDGAYDSGPHPPYGPGGAQYYDDNEWIAFDLLRAYDLVHSRPLLVRARQLFAFVTTGWDRDPTHACPGGVFWTRAPGNTDRNAVTTANGALLALELYRRTGRVPYLHWAETMHRWVQRCLLSPEGLVLDHLGLDGRVDPAAWSYNQGAMIAAGAGLFKATHRRAYLRGAIGLARAALGRYTRTDFGGEPACFVAIFFRDLSQLEQVAPDAAFRAAAAGFAERRWQEGRDPETGLFVRPRGDEPLLEQAAMVQIYAALAAR